MGLFLFASLERDRLQRTVASYHRRDEHDSSNGAAVFNTGLCVFLWSGGGLSRWVLHLLIFISLSLSPFFPLSFTLLRFSHPPLLFLSPFSCSSSPHSLKEKLFSKTPTTNLKFLNSPKWRVQEANSKGEFKWRIQRTNCKWNRCGD